VVIDGERRRESGYEPKPTYPHHTYLVRTEAGGMAKKREKGKKGMGPL
jgi:hypothetical protein